MAVKPQFFNDQILFTILGVFRNVEYNSYKLGSSIKNLFLLFSVQLLSNCNILMINIVFNFGIKIRTCGF